MNFSVGRRNTLVIVLTTLKIQTVTYYVRFLLHVFLIKRMVKFVFFF